MTEIEALGKDLETVVVEFNELLMEVLADLEKGLGRGADGQLPEGYRDAATLVGLAAKIAQQKWVAGFRAAT